MAGAKETASEVTRETYCSFQWDESSGLYFHASSGFYHDPRAGWYYSSKDGLYYTYENGEYVLLQAEKGRDIDGHVSLVTDSNSPVQNREDEINRHAEGMVHEEMERPRPTSEWLEETLIDLYLMGYSNLASQKDEISGNLEMDGSPSGNVCQKLHDQSCSEMNISKEEVSCPHSRNDIQDSHDPTCEEENWRAQYGQVTEAGNDAWLSFSLIDLWDWEMIVQSEGRKEVQVARLVGRIVKPMSRPHPSMPSGGSLLKTAAILETHLDMVRVASGKVYRLRTPSSRYLASLSKYDSSNPTKDWGFPDLLSEPSITSGSGGSLCAEYSDDGAVGVDLTTNQGHDPSKLHKDRSQKYRDRAAERRTLHGGYGVGPGQKNQLNDCLNEEESSFSPSQTEEAAVEAAKMSFGPGSYARRILESMGWKEGEALGSTNKGLTEPLKAEGNKGNAGLGWIQERM